jgi:SAM-dependent methyltransferase
MLKPTPHRTGRCRASERRSAHRCYKPDLDILIAGCGTNQAAVFAYTNRPAKVTAIDVSETSLKHQQYLKDKHGLHNLELHLLSIEELSTLGLDFDLIVSTGVLHHMAAPLTGMKALADCLRPDGAMGLMLYATYGRTGIYLLQSVFRDFGLQQDEASLNVVKDVLANLPADHPIQNYFKISTDWHFDAGLVDMFLHGRDRSFTVDECIDLVTTAGLAFQGWLYKSPYYLNDVCIPVSPLTAAVNALPERKMWSVMERLIVNNGCHSFKACRPERPKEGYTIDFSTRDSVDYVPMMRRGCGLSGSEVIRLDFHLGLDAAQLEFVRHIDGRRTVRDIAERMARSPGSWQDTAGKVQDYGREVCEWLWRLDVIAIALAPTTASPTSSPAKAR